MFYSILWYIFHINCIKPHLQLLYLLSFRFSLSFIDPILLSFVDMLLRYTLSVSWSACMGTLSFSIIYRFSFSLLPPDVPEFEDLIKDNLYPIWCIIIGWHAKDLIWWWVAFEQRLLSCSLAKDFETMLPDRARIFFFFFGFSVVFHYTITLNSQP